MEIAGNSSGSSDATSPEPPILRARARGEISGEAAFERLYSIYAPVVLGWLMMRVGAAEADDLFQDVWAIFYGRWLNWQHRPEMEAPDARPVLSFLYRTCHFVLKGHRRRSSRIHEPVDAVEVADDRRQPERMLREVEFGRCLQLAREICSAEELDVLLAKLAGTPAREIARTLEITEAAVDHRFRNAVTRLRKRLNARGR